MRTFILIALLILVSACQEKMVVPSDLQHISLSLETEQKLFLSEIADSIEIIPLEQTDESDLATVMKIIYHKGRYYLLNSIGYASKSVQVFDGEGKFLFKLDERGQGPNEWVELNDFTINERTDELVLLGLPRKMLIYDLDGNIKKVVKLEKTYSTICTDIGNQYYVTSEYCTELKPYWLTLINDTACHDFCKVEEKDFVRINHYTFSNDFAVCNADVYASYPFCDTIFNITKGVMTPAFYLDYCGRNLPASSIFKAGYDMQQIDREKQKYSSRFRKSAFAFSDKYGYVSSQDGNQHVFVSLYSRHSEKVISGCRLVDDVFFPNNTLKFTSSNVFSYTIKDDYLLCLFRPSWLMRGYETYKKKLSKEKWEMFCKHQAKMVDVCSKLDEESNPVLLRIKLKDF